MKRAVLAMATDRGVLILKPGNEATEYTVASQGLLNRKCRCVARAGDGKVVAGTADFFVQLSSDGFEWKSSLAGLNRQNITSVSRHPQHSNLLFAGTSSPALFASDDAGQSWKATAPLESLTNVTRWTARKPPYLACISSIACHPNHEGVVVLSIEIGGIAATRNWGQSWSRRDEGLPADVRRVIAPPVPGRLYAGTSAGFFRSDDLGGTWQEKNKGIPYTHVRAMAVAAGDPNIILISVSKNDEGLSAILMSRDAGESWEVSSQGLPRLDDRLVTALIFGPGGFYAGTNRGDLFGLDNLEGRWTRLGANYPPINGLLALT